MRKMTIAGILGISLFIFAACSGGSGGDAGGKEAAIVKLTSSNDFFTTVTKLQSAIAANNLVLLKEYNIQAMMKMVNKSIESNMTYQTFHPRYGKILIESDPDAFVSTPLSFVVRQAGSKVELLYRKPSDVYRMFAVPSSLTGELDRIFNDIATVATQ